MRRCLTRNCRCGLFLLCVTALLLRTFYPDELISHPSSLVSKTNDFQPPSPKLALSQTKHQSNSSLVIQETIHKYDSGLEISKAKHQYNSSIAMIQRGRYTKELCHSAPYNKTRFVAAGKSLISMNSQRLLYCPIPKVGRSTWKRLFYRQAGVEHLVEDFTHIGYESQWSKANLQLISNTLGSSFSSKFQHRLVFVRNPYDRMVSAYKDKALKNNGNYVQEMKTPCRTFNNPPLPALTFAQFVKCIIQKAKAYNRDTTVFGSGRNLDFHWRPQTLLCDFCRSDYTLYGHMEHMNEDLVEALETLQMNTTVVQDNVFETNGSKPLPLSHWYSQLDSDLMKEFQKLYSHDFKILGYNLTVPES